MNTKLRHAKAYGTGHSGFNPMSLSPVAWFKFNTGITVTGSGVSQWDDQSGNERHLKQGTDANRPSKEVDGSILFNGTGHYLKCDAFTLNQPCTIYIRGKQITWTSNDRIMDGNALNSGGVFQGGVTPQIQLFAGSSAATNGTFTLDTYATLQVIFNGASSAIQINDETATSGNAGAANMGGFTLGAQGNAANFGHIQVKEILIYSTNHLAVTRTLVKSYLKNI